MEKFPYKPPIEYGNDLMDFCCFWANNRLSKYFSGNVVIKDDSWRHKYNPTWGFNVCKFYFLDYEFSLSQELKNGHVNLLVSKIYPSGMTQDVYGFTYVNVCNQKHFIRLMLRFWRLVYQRFS